ncbi:glycosyl transferase-like protein [Falsiroseomonas bella]|uniref:Glycosyl transferase-like protein n=1 Tax=Falsiroseomonas bella TaxID=2184016 RepID=A0A317FAA8_9PROT|nr:glycosyltransferase [Falsiroseomonas bella]PWS34967.1 glycosyl transferase-like protein [Falsiroseomonas bella]
MPPPPSPPSAALLYAPDGYDTSRPRLMGRHAAGEGFLIGLVRHAGFERMVALTRGEADAEAFRRHVATLGAAAPAEAIPDNELQRLAGIGCLMLPGPGLGEHAWRRRRIGPATAWSLVGVTHTIASAGAMDSILDSLVAPVQPWDAIVCTSEPVRGAVRRLLEMQGGYLARRLGATRIEGPALPVIPLGVDCAALAPDPRARAEWRARLELREQDVAVLHHGRLSFHAKAHPLPMFLALGRAAAKAPPGARVVLILSGWFADETQRRAFHEQAKAVAPHLEICLVERPETGTTLRNAADIFTLLSDNVQESFGLAPVEALAAGLPVVGTDWDGLKDTIRHGETGYRVPTTLGGPMPDLAERHDAGFDSYDSFIAGVAQFTAVDVPAAEAAFAALIADPVMRRAMGAAARRDALARFDWPVVIGQWRALWAELARLRREARAERAAPLRGEARVPHRPDPSILFAHYPTRRLAPETRLMLPPGEDAAAVLVRLRAYAGLPGAAPRRDLLPSMDSIQAALEVLEQGPATAARLSAELQPLRAWRMNRSLAWLLKLDLLRLADG